MRELPGLADDIDWCIGTAYRNTDRRDVDSSWNRGVLFRSADSFSALVSDLEDASEDLIVIWTSNVDGELVLDTSVNPSKRFRIIPI